MDLNQLGMLENLQALEFSALEFVLYLNTHPTDQRALMDYSNLAKESAQYKQMYESCYGPLTAEDSTNNQGYWKWIETPWPWEIEY
jgi:spore coat protein JB